MYLELCLIHIFVLDYKKFYFRKNLHIVFRKDFCYTLKTLGQNFFKKKQNKPAKVDHPSGCSNIIKNNMVKMQPREKRFTGPK